LAYSITNVLIKIVVGKVLLRMSRAKKPSTVRHRISVNGEDRYSLRVDMIHRIVALEGPFAFQTIPGASSNLCDYEFHTTQRPARYAQKPKTSTKEAAVGSFIQIFYGSSSYDWIGEVAEKHGDDYFVYHMKETKPGSKEYRRSPVGPWVVKRKSIARYDVRLRQTAPGLWVKFVWRKRANPEKKKKNPKIMQPLASPAIPDLEENPKKRMMGEVKLMQEHAKRIRMTLETLERATTELAAHWSLPLVK
jgi:hypothetical protein